MSQPPYRRTPGDFELRVLKDGRFVLVAPDEDLMALGEVLAQNEPLHERPHDATRPDQEEQSHAK